MMLNSMQKKLLTIAFLITPVMAAVFKASEHYLGTSRGYLAGLTMYWLCCLYLSSWGFSSAGKAGAALFNKGSFAGTRLKWLALAMIPAAGVLVLEFLPHCRDLTMRLAVLVVFTALVNGTLEEVFWRGVFALHFPGQRLVLLGIAPLLFGLWHVAIYAGSGLEFGGLGPLAGGALIMGLLWAWCFYRSERLYTTIAAHVAVNMLAFTGLYIKNGF